MVPGGSWSACASLILQGGDGQDLSMCFVLNPIGWDMGPLYLWFWLFLVRYVMCIY